MSRSCAYVIVCIFVLAFVANSCALDNVWWCGVRVRSCAKREFAIIINRKLEEIAKKMATTQSGTVVRTTAVTGQTTTPTRRRRKREEGTTVMAAGTTSQGQGTTTTTTEANFSIPPTKLYRPDDWEETFYKCLDEWRQRDRTRCKVFTAQRCTWNDGQSNIISKYCQKWGVPCRRCRNSS